MIIHGNNLLIDINLINWYLTITQMAVSSALRYVSKIIYLMLIYVYKGFTYCYYSSGSVCESSLRIGDDFVS